MPFPSSAAKFGSVRTALVRAADLKQAEFRGGGESNLFIQINTLFKQNPVTTFIRSIWHSYWDVQEEDWAVLLEIQGKRIPGLRTGHVRSWIDSLAQENLELRLEMKTVLDLPQTSNDRRETGRPTYRRYTLIAFMQIYFPHGSFERDIQLSIRANMESQTVPVTTRAPREDELADKACNFVSVEEFESLREESLLLESGSYNGIFCQILDNECL
ncbi:hypothetical protein BV898_17127 [Hypsibius exemplaris]|uniref:Guanylate kinase-like domain-containing protein n=1 Tax=Hypsibius exemplaris TaxID=2072580 RepID=A0A9X6NHH7_HYPEX|nr:hypothetical protein BV898_17127 [Hypsibius exemplaris]